MANAYQVVAALITWIKPLKSVSNVMDFVRNALEV